MTLPDPKRRKDALCVVCKRPIKVPVGKWAREAALLDPFCSSGCCHRWHNLELGSFDDRLEEVDEVAS